MILVGNRKGLCGGRRVTGVPTVRGIEIKWAVIFRGNGKTHNLFYAILNKAV